MRMRSILLLLPLACTSLPLHASTLYERLGGQAGVEAVVGELIDTSAASPLTSRTFQQKVDIKRVKKLLAEQVCEAAGGGCRYSGDNMKVVHAGLKITDAEFNGMVSHLKAILDKYHVAAEDQQALLGVLAPMKTDIVTQP